MFKFSGLPKLLESSLEEFASFHDSVSEPTSCTSKCSMWLTKGHLWLAVETESTFGSTPIPDTVKLRDGYNFGHAQFTVVPVSGGKIALKANIGKYVARCNGCIKDGAVRDFLVIFHDNPNNPNVQFTPELLPNGNYALKSNLGQYVSRYNGCSPTALERGVTQDTVTVHQNSPSGKLHAQWKVIPLPIR